MFVLRGEREAVRVFLVFVFIVMLSGFVNADFPVPMLDINEASVPQVESLDVQGNVQTDFQFWYDSIGNILNVTGSQHAEYYYDGELPHAPSRFLYY